MSLNILVVDDHEGMALTLKDILVDEGYEVDIALGGKPALAAAKKKTYDAALLDLRMPDMDGVELFYQLKLVRPDILVVMMSAYMDKGLEDSAMKLGAIDFLHKPLDLDLVLEIFRSFTTS